MQKNSLMDSPSWNSNDQPPWYNELKKKSINDKKWSCIVTAAIQNEAQDEDHILRYTESVNTGLRKSVKVISMSDVMKQLKCLTKNGNSSKKLKTERSSALIPKPAPPRFSQVLDLAVKYGTLTDNDCKLPPDLMAAVLKYMILSLKDENILHKRIDAVKDRKIRDQNIKAKFIRNLKPFETRRESIISSKTMESAPEVEETIQDEPIDGADLYIMLTDFYNVLYFVELQLMNVPLIAIIRISSQGTFHTSESELGYGGRKKSAVSMFWENLNELILENTSLKNIAMMEYRAPLTTEDPKLNSKIIFDELTWMQYSVYYILRQYEKYLEELSVQRLILALEPLDLSKCELYNELCNALVTGGPLTPLLVLYAIVEQVVEGVPDTESSAVEYSRKKSNFFAAASPKPTGRKKTQIFQTPCNKCRGKQLENFCEKLKTQLKSETAKETKTIENSEENLLHLSQSARSEITERSGEFGEGDPLEFRITKSTISRVMSERKTEKEIREDKMWKTPRVIFYGDSIFFQSLQCDSRLFNLEDVYDRFLKNQELFQIWMKYPKLPPEERAFCNFHFYRLWRTSKQTKEQLELKILFALSMKLIGKSKSCLRLEDESFKQEKEEPVQLSPEEPITEDQEKKEMEKENQNFHNYFFKTFITDKYFSVNRRTDIEDYVEVSEQQNGTPRLTYSEACLLTCFRQFETSLANTTLDFTNPHDRILMTFYFLLDCFDISNLTEPHFLNNLKNYEDLMKSYKFYEKLEPNLMMQRLLKAQEDFNTILTSYFAPTDTLVMVMLNDSDYRGIFSTYESQVLPTPVCFRDFYCFVYPRIGEWLIDENAENDKFISQLEEQIKAKKEEEDEMYLSQLKHRYCSMNEKQRKEFLDDETLHEWETSEKELPDLPVRPKPSPPDKLSFLATCLTDVRVENNKKITEFNSQDGTQVRLTFDSWVFEDSGFLNLRIKRPKSVLYYYQQLNQEKINQDFIFRTNTDIIFSFRKKLNGKYDVTVSWPTGLLLQPIRHDESLYIRQTYLKPYKNGWEIEGEVSRCFLNNGQVLILKKDKDYDILYGSGTKIAFRDSSTVPEFEIASTTGEIWQIQIKSSKCKKKKLIGTNKILEGVDPKTRETFYKREDGVMCMLWPNGTLVTNYPDGTKITTTPYFGEIIDIKWTEQERQCLSELLPLKSSQSVQEPRSRTILRRSVSVKATQRQSLDPEPFLSISCEYLMEHPKYSSIFFSGREPHAKATMPENLNLRMCPEGYYEIQQDGNVLRVKDWKVEFDLICEECKHLSSVRLNLDGNEVLCRCVDFFEKAFFVYLDGRTRFQERYQEREGEFERVKQNEMEKCEKGHAVNPSLNQRCFGFRRDLSGVEFLHADHVSLTLHQIPEETYFDLETDDPDNITHTFNIPFYKVGNENWQMDYLEKNNSMPVNLKKRDLKEMGVKQTPKNSFKYPFPKHHTCCQKTNVEKISYKEPKIIMTRTIKCLSSNPDSVIRDLQECVKEYQKKARKIFQEYLNHKSVDGRTEDSRYVAMRLRKIAATLSQSLQMFPHLCTNVPSTEKDIHYFGHFVNFGEVMKAHARDGLNVLPDCKQIPARVPRSRDFPCIYEESESPRNT